MNFKITIILRFPAGALPKRAEFADRVVAAAKMLAAAYHGGSVVFVSSQTATEADVAEAGG